MSEFDTCTRQERDAAADLAICEAATPGTVKWQKFGVSYCLTGQYGLRPIIFTTIKVEKEGYIDEVHISNRDAEKDVLIPLHPEHPDSKLIEMAWELPYWIHRAQELQAELEETRAREAVMRTALEEIEARCENRADEDDAHFENLYEARQALSSTAGAKYVQKMHRLEKVAEELTHPMFDCGADACWLADDTVGQPEDEPPGSDCPYKARCRELIRLEKMAKAALAPEVKP